MFSISYSSDFVLDFLFFFLFFLFYDEQNFISLSLYNPPNKMKLFQNQQNLELMAQNQKLRNNFNEKTSI